MKGELGNKTGRLRRALPTEAPKDVEPALDDDGRIALATPAGDETSLDYSTRAFRLLVNEDPLDTDTLRKNCHRVDDAELDASFWLPCGSEPRNALESIVAEIFAHHSGVAVTTSGSEFVRVGQKSSMHCAGVIETHAGGK